MFVRTIFVVGFLAVAAILAVGTLVSGGDGADTAKQLQPPASALDEAAATTAPPGDAGATATPESPRPTNTPRPKPTEAAASGTPSSAAGGPSGAQSTFSGIWTVSYTITAGLGAGESYAFDMTLEQNGRSIRGGNDGMFVTGVADGQTATLTYRQPALDYTATFTLTLVDGSWGGGAFTSAVNSGTSRVQRVR